MPHCEHNPIMVCNLCQEKMSKIEKQMKELEECRKYLVIFHDKYCKHQNINPTIPHAIDMIEDFVGTNAYSFSTLGKNYKFNKQYATVKSARRNQRKK